MFERAIKEPFVPTYEEMDDALTLHEYGYAFLNKKEELNVPVDVAAAYEKLNTAIFQKYAKKMSWLSQCLYFGENLYGIFDKDVLLEMYNARKGFRIPKDELEQLCNEFPADMTECRLEEGNRFIIAKYLAYDGSYKDLIDIQSGKDFYIPSAEQVQDYFKNLYLSKEPAYEKLRKFFMSEIGMSYRDADDEVTEIWQKIQEDWDFQEIIGYLFDTYGDDLGEHEAEKLAGLLQNANNNTRMMIHRGHTPNEMVQRDIANGLFAQKPIVMPGSMQAANLLKGAVDELTEMGISVDLDSNAAAFSDASGVKKVYPNDPCPCGSGKKYKKCCGRS